MVRVPALVRRATRYRDPGVPDGEAALARRGIALVGSIKSWMLVEEVGRASWMAEFGATVRDWARAMLDRHVARHDARSAAVARAVLLGDRAGLDQQTQERLQQAGTYHVIAISGGNIAILTGLLLLLLRLVRIRSPVAECGSAAVLVAYAGLVGGGASVVRATMMAVTYLAARARDLRSPPLNAMAVAGGLVLAATPLAVFDPGTWLTFGATLSILVGVGRVFPLLGLRRWWARAAVGLLLASLSAELALFPISAFAFSRVTAAGLVVNFAAVPLMSVVQVAGMATLVLGACADACGTGAGYVTHLAAWGLVESARFIDWAPWLTTRIPAPGWAAMAAYYAGWAAVYWTWSARPVATGRGRPARARARMVTWGGSALIVASAAWMLTAPHGRRVLPGHLRVTWLDVGQGDTTLVELPGGRTLLVDAGGAGGSSFDIGRRVIEPVLWARGIRRLDYLALSHPDADHASGAAVVTRDLRPFEIWEGVPVIGLALRDELMRAAEDVGAASRTLLCGDRLREGQAEVRVWHPPPADWERQRVRNDDSVVIEIRFGDVSIVLPGDVEASAESDLVNLLAPSPLRVIEAPHHGSATSSTAEWLDAMAADAVVISAGQGNRYGHPHAAVLGRFRARRLPVFRTDQEGAVTLETDGRTLTVSTFSGRRWAAGPATASAR